MKDNHFHTTRRALGSGTRWAATLSVVLAAGMVLSSCGDGDPFSVGDCVVVSPDYSSGDFDMKSVDCSVGLEETGDTELPMRVIDVLDGANQNCSGLSFAGISFSHEPHDKTYCLEPNN